MPPHCRMRAFDRDLIRGGHYGQRPCAPHKQAKAQLTLSTREPQTVRPQRLCAMCGRLRVGKDFLHVAAWSERPCVRPVDAARMTAGHNALRGSGPGQKPAFDNAMALVGCPDLRIDRICITCCSPLPTFTSRRLSDAISCRQRGRFLVALALGHHRPRHASDLVGKRNCGNLRRPPRQ